MELHLKDSYSPNDINELIKNKIEESYYLDYKSGEALGFEDSKKIEISKDVSSFANSDGGIIVYGIREKDHLPLEISPINGRTFTKEWLEHIITDNIQPRIPDLHIYPIRFENKLDKTIYLVKIPSSPVAPHMCNNNRYYKRFDFKSIPMMEFEVRRLYSRPLSTKLNISGVYLERLKGYEMFDDIKHKEFEIGVLIKNTGKLVEKDYKVKLQFRSIDDIQVRFSYSPLTTDLLMEESLNLKNSLVSKSNLPLFPDEETTCLKFSIQVPFDQEEQFRNNCILKIILLYSSGTDSAEYKVSDMTQSK